MHLNLFFFYSILYYIFFQPLNEYVFKATFLALKFNVNTNFILKIFFLQLLRYSLKIIRLIYHFLAYFLSFYYFHVQCFLCYLCCCYQLNYINYYYYYYYEFNLMIFLDEHHPLNLLCPFAFFCFFLFFVFLFFFLISFILLEN